MSPQKIYINSKTSYFSLIKKTDRVIIDYYGLYTLNMMLIKYNNKNYY